MKFGDPFMLCLALKCLGSEFVGKCLCLCGDQGENVACVLGCAEVRGLPARQIKSGRLPADDANCSTTAWSIVSLSR